ncbi:unnamed protein product [Choristocarpus tenellus]
MAEEAQSGGSAGIGVFRNLFRRACQCWFALWLVVCMFWCYVGCYVGYHLLPGSTPTKQMRACYVCHYTFKYLLLFPVPWIQVSTPPEEEILRLLDRQRVFLLMNHTSYLDSIIFVGHFPPKVLRRYRTLMKASLFQLPLLGFISQCVGHFPVYFLTPRPEEFGVDKVKQTEVMLQVNSYIENGGCLSMFPEGMVGKVPGELLPFRRGTFTLAHKTDMPVVSLAMNGNYHAWPRKSVIGGFPSMVTMKLSEVVESNHGLTPDELLEKSSKIMQDDLNSLFSRKEVALGKKDL